MFKSVRNYTLNTLLDLTRRRIVNWKKTSGAHSATMYNFYMTGPEYKQQHGFRHRYTNTQDLQY